MKPAFNAHKWAMTYAKRHRKTDEGITEIHFLPQGAPENEIRLVEVNEHLAEQFFDPVQAFEIGVDSGSTSAHTLAIVDVTPGQWKRILDGKLGLPPGWSLQNMKQV